MKTPHVLKRRNYTIAHINSIEIDMYFSLSDFCCFFNNDLTMEQHLAPRMPYARPVPIINFHGQAEIMPNML